MSNDYIQDFQLKYSRAKDTIEKLKQEALDLYQSDNSVLDVSFDKPVGHYGKVRNYHNSIYKNQFKFTKESEDQHEEDSEEEEEKDYPATKGMWVRVMEPSFISSILAERENRMKIIAGENESKNGNTEQEHREPEKSETEFFQQENINLPIEADNATSENGNKNNLIIESISFGSDICNKHESETNLEHDKDPSNNTSEIAATSNISLLPSTSEPIQFKDDLDYSGNDNISAEQIIQTEKKDQFQLPLMTSASTNNLEDPKNQLSDEDNFSEDPLDLKFVQGILSELSLKPNSKKSFKSSKDPEKLKNQTKIKPLGFARLVENKVNNIHVKK